jgi:hypothetical protein
MPAVAFDRLIFSREFPHRIVRGRAADARMGFDAVPFHHQDHAARIFDASQKLYAVRAGVISFGKKLAEDLDVFVSSFRRDVLSDDFVDHSLPLCVSFIPLVTRAGDAIVGKAWLSAARLGRIQGVRIGRYDDEGYRHATAWVKAGGLSE